MLAVHAARAFLSFVCYLGILFLEKVRREDAQTRWNLVVRIYGNDVYYKCLYMS
jgi:hypothetical protein